MSRSGVAVALTGAVVAALAVGVAVIVGRAVTQEPAGPSAPTDPAGVSSTRLPEPTDSYWTPERMRSAQPAPMPEE